MRISIIGPPIVTDPPSFPVTPLQFNHDMRKARAAKVASREDVVSMFHLGDVISEIETEATRHAEAGRPDLYIALNGPIAKLKSLIPIRP